MRSVGERVSVNMSHGYWNGRIEHVIRGGTLVSPDLLALLPHHSKVVRVSSGTRYIVLCDDGKRRMPGERHLDHPLRARNGQSSEAIAANPKPRRLGGLLREPIYATTAAGHVFGQPREIHTRRSEVLR